MTATLQAMWAVVQSPMVWVPAWAFLITWVIVRHTDWRNR